jgi:hypothetical protein
LKGFRRKRSWNNLRYCADIYMEGLAKRFSNCGACPLGGVVGPLGGALVFCMRDIFILDEIWTQYNIYIYIYILVGTLLGLNILLTT